MKRESEFQIEKLKNNFNEEKERIDNEQKAARMKQDFEIEYARKKLDLDKEHNETTLLKYQIDTTERIYGKIGVRELKINQFSGDMKTNLLNLIPMMGAGLVPKNDWTSFIITYNLN